MQIGIIGLQYSGKTTLFHTLIKSEITENLSTDKVNVGVVKVPDERLDKLTKIFNPTKQVNATIEFVDIPGIALADDGKLKITSQFLNQVRTNDALLFVVRAFKNDAVPHPNNEVNPVKDIEFLETEFILSDMAAIENKIEKIKKDIQKQKNDQILKEQELFNKLNAHIEKLLPLRQLELSNEEKKLISGFQFLTLKPMIVVVNIGDDEIIKSSEIINNIKFNINDKTIPVTALSAKIEYEISLMSDEEAEEFMKDYGIKESALNNVVRTAYQSLGLQSFFTVGEDECRAWTIKKGYTAQEAAGVIHSDFYQKFIRAEVVSYEDFMKYENFAKCKEAGVWRLEGKEYIVKDGDILNIRHN
ncbi:MAG TPA: redox-regulated ATPase YchF [Ignavibacteriales bacterium]|nr:redox-regulated ATPase YchF [Ignavibacteriales bacterium]HOL81100.1 redox-regulated ATPase YchF [Ignavibacteriales bacterium]HOM65204.1 redox-regulated ATPase YchF [Ignavibacteriales bacterium]HPD66496.1 redox-regulated ATPase YchF [Ignavibacteriales bacterium]HPP33544.1 redox-regulated ATPase YchF [Ignavibacteriales bacterium]